MSVMDLSSFALLLKRVFPASLGVREGREGSPGGPSAAARPGTSSHHRGVGYSDLNPGRKTNPGLQCLGPAPGDTSLPKISKNS